MELLENRLALANAVWDGGGGDNNWLTAANWVGDDAPSTGDDLWFVGGAAQLTSVNNFSAGTTFNSINFAGGGYTITGAAVRLTGNISAINAAGRNVFDLPITFTAARSITNTFAGTELSLAGNVVLGGNLTIGGSGTTSVNGSISGAAGIVKNGPGQLYLGGDSTYTGVTTINAGKVTVSGFGNPLGDETVGTVVKSGATLQTQHINDNMAEPLTLSGPGLLGDVLGSATGALQIGGPAFTTWTGPINLASDAAIGVEHTGNFTLAATSVIRLNGNLLTINGMGDMQFHGPIVDGAASGRVAINTGLVRGTHYGVVNTTANNTYTGSTLINAGVLNLTGTGRIASTDIQLRGAPGGGMSDGFPIPGGVLRIDNSTAPNNNRVPDDAEITFQGGALHFVGFNGAASTETVGNLHFLSGQSYVRSEAAPDFAASNTLTATSLIRDPGATVDFSGPALGTPKNRLVFSSAPANVGSGGGILPYATFTGAGQDFARYDASQGIAPFTNYVTNLATASPGDIVLVTSSQTVAANKTVAALMIRDQGTAPAITIAPGVTLSVTRALATSATVPNGVAKIIPGTGAGNAPRIAFGAEGIIHRNAATTIETVIAGNTALTLSGVAPLNVAPPTGGNTYSGGTTVNSGVVSIVQNNTPFGTGALKLQGGVLDVNVFVGDLPIPNALVLNNANAAFSGLHRFIFGGSITLTGDNILVVPGNVEVEFAGKVSGSGSLIVTAAMNTGSGGGTMILSNAANDYTGGTTLVNSGIFQSTLQLDAPTVLGSGPLHLAGGNITAGVPLTLAKPFTLASSNITFGGTNPITLSGDISMIGINTLARNFFGGPPVTISGVISGSGAINKSGDHVLTFTANNTYTGSTLAREGTLVIKGNQPASAAGAITAASVPGMLSGTGVVGQISAAAGGIVAPGDAAVMGRLFASGANFSDGGVLRLRVGEDAPSGADFDWLQLGTGRLIVGPNSPLEVDVSGLASQRRVLEAVRYGSRLGVIGRFAPINVLNNPNNFGVEADYTATAMNLTIASGPNGAPVITAPGNQNTTEDSTVVFSGTRRIQVSDPDAGDAPIELSLIATHGALTLASTAGLTFQTGDGTADSTLVFTGSIDDINAAINGMRFKLQANYAGSASLLIDADDLGSLGLGGSKQDSATVRINVSAVNDPGKVVIQGVPREDRVLTAVVADNDGVSAVNYQWQRSSGSGFTNIAGATASTYTPGDADVGQKIRVRATYTDGQGFAQTLTSPATATIANVNDRPVIGSFGANVSFREGNNPVVISTTATVGDVDSLNLAGGKLIVRLTTGRSVDDILAIKTAGNVSTSGNEVLFAGVEIGTFTGGTDGVSLIVTFNAAASLGRAQAVLRSVTFSNESENPTTTTRTLIATLSDGDGGVSAPVSKSISLVAVNDAPVIAPASSVTGYENGGAAVQLLPSGTVTDVDSANFVGGKLLVRITGGAHASNRLYVGGPFTLVGNQVRLGGTTVGTLNANAGEGTTSLQVNFHNVSKSVAQTLIRSIRFRTTNSASTAQRLMEFNLSDGDGATSAAAVVRVNVS